MDDFTLPVELQQLERDLLGRQLPDASESLRRRVLDDVQASRRSEQRRSRWQFGIGVAAAALLWLNLSLSVTLATNFGFRQRANHESIDALAADIRRVVPEMTDCEARREAFLLQASCAMVPYPKVPPGYSPNRTEIN